MTCEELLDFIDNRMQMSHIYQPLMIRALVDAGGTATLPKRGAIRRAL
jgi:ATP adenylyltransferase